MKSCIVAIATGLALFASLSANAQLLTRECAANDSMSEFERRMPSKAPELAANARQAEITGWNLYRYEALQDIASSAIAEALPFGERVGIKGSIVVPGDVWTVRFYAMDDSDFFVPAVDVVFSSETDYRIVQARDAEPFSDSELALITATELVSAMDTPCDSTYKVVVLPGSDGTIHAYQICEGQRMMNVPEGQHIRYDISEDGTTVLGQQEYARRCNPLATRKSDDENSVLELANLSSAIFPQPSELHVYLSLRYGVNIYLATLQSNLYWHVDRGIIKIDL